MISNDERREVAARLRFTDHNMTWSEGCFCIADDVGAAPTGNEHDDVLAFAHALADLIEPEPERTCHMELRKQGVVYDVFYFDCCDKEYAENRNDSNASKISGDVCPYCGAKVVE